MIENGYYFENTNELTNALDTIRDTFPCFIGREFVEMNFSFVTIKARCEDIAGIERILAPLA